LKKKTPGCQQCWWRTNALISPSFSSSMATQIRLKSILSTRIKVKPSHGATTMAKNNSKLNFTLDLTVHGLSSLKQFLRIKFGVTLQFP
jgi:hypothetical protein